MAKDDLNFNLEEFLASHANDAKQVQVPKKRRPSSSSKSSSKTKKPTSSGTAKGASKPKTDDTAKEIALETSAVETAEDIKIISEENTEHEQLAEETAFSTDVNSVESVEISQDFQDIGESMQHAQGFADDSQSDVDFAQDFDDDCQSDVDLAQGFADDSHPDDDVAQDTVFDSETVDVIKPENEMQPKSDAKDDVWARLEEKFGKLSDENAETTPEQAFEEPLQSPLPRYKENTTEIGFSKKRLSDTATVGVRKINRSEVGENGVIIGENTQTSEELDLQEKLRHDREITEKILRRAYAQEEQSVELGTQKAEISENATEKITDDANIGGRYKQKNRQKKGKKQKIEKEQRALPVVQVGTTDEDDSQSIMDMLENALDEDIIELEYVSKNSEETPSYNAVPERKKNKMQTLYFFVGLFFTVMSIIGIVVTAKSAVGFVKNFSDDSKQKEEFAEYIYPVVITDPAAFESVNDLSDEVIIKASLWDIIMYDENSKYEQDASGNMYVPYIQVENHAKSLFGTTNIVHSTVVFSQELTFFYDFETRMYKVPVSPQLFPNTPVVTEIQKTGERYTLTVDYQEPTPNWALMDSDYTPGIIKTMEYVLTKYNDGYTVISINSVE